jgi:Domain of unknown function (DUF4126)/Short C-terminal domain
MENYEALMATLALTMGASWASGINLYAVLLVLGIGGSTGNIDLPPDLAVLENPMVIGAAGLMYFVEFFADKVPGVDSGWDTLHTFVRIPAGAMLAAGAVGDVTPALEIAAGIMGGGMAATSHATKAGSRLLINTSPEPVTNWTASITEDIMVFAGLWTALNHPLVFLILLIVFIVAVVWLMPKLWRGIKLVFGKLGELLGIVEKKDEAVTAGLTTQPAATTNDQRLEELERLQALKDKGALTPAEFEQEKRRVMR